MDINSMVLGGPTGIVGQGLAKGQQETDRREKARADLMQLMQQMQLERAREGREAELHPLTVEQRRLGNRESQLRGNKAEFDFSLDQLYGGRQRAATVEKAELENKSKGAEEVLKQGNNFIEALGPLAATGAIDDASLEDTAKQILGPHYQSQPLYTVLKGMDPATRAKQIPKSMLGSSKSILERQKQKELYDREEMRQKQMTSREEAKTAARERGRMAAATAKAGATPKTIEARLVQIRTEYNKTTDPTKREELAAEFEEWQRIKQEMRVTAGLVVGTDAAGDVTLKERTPQTVPLGGVGVGGGGGGGGGDNEPVRITTQAEAAALAPGTIFIGPDGVKRQR